MKGNLRVAVRALLIGLASTLPLEAQSLDDALAEVRWSLDEEGALRIAPDPSTGDPESAPGLVVNLQHGTAFQNLGALGFASILLQGGVDFAGLIDAAGLARKLGVTEEELVVRLSNPPAVDAPRTERLRYRIWLHAAEQLGLRPAIGPLRKVAADAQQPDSLRRAARGAMTRLGGDAPETATSPVRPLVIALAEVPAEAFATIVCENHRLPPPWALLDLAERTGMLVTRQEVQAAGGTVSSSAAAGAAMLTATPGVLGYELARQLGNHRIDRTLAAIFVDPQRMEPLVWASFEGAFELAELRAGLEDLGVPHGIEEDEGRLTGVVIVVEGGPRLEVREDRAVLAMEGIEVAPLGPDGAAEMLTRFDGFQDLPLRIRFGELPEELGIESARFGALPNVVGLQPAYTLSERWVVRGGYDEEGVAEALERQLEGLPRLIESQVGDLDLPESFYEQLERIETSREGATVTLQIPGWIPGDDVLAELLRGLR